MLEPSTGLTSRLTSDIDLERAGRTESRLGVIHSDGSDVEYGIVPIPVVTFVNGDGPTVLLAAGTHGDEWEGQLLLHKLARDLDLSKVRGRLIVMPALNAPAVLDSSRVSPLDGGNLNRAYPGDRDGGPTSQIADYLSRYLLPQCDFAADLHSGGGCTEFVPCGFMTRMPHGRRTAQQAQALQAFGMPYTVVYDEATEDRALDTECDRADVVMVATELSGGATVTLETLRAAEEGLRRMLVHWNVLIDDTLPATAGTRFLDVNSPDSSVMVMCRGLFEPSVGLGEQVWSGQVVGWVHPLHDLTSPSQPVAASTDGIVYQRRVPPMVQPGNIVMSIGTPVDQGGL